MHSAITHRSQDDQNVEKGSFSQNFMPKTTPKRAEAKRAARIAKAHATQLPLVEVKEPKQQKKASGYRAPARGIARYPWATGILIVLIVALGIYALYFYHAGPFALAAKPKASTKSAQAQAAVASPCIASNVVKQITNTSAAPTDAQFAATKHQYSQPPAMTINTQKTYCAGINTNRGLIVVELDPKLAPNTVNNFVFLAQHQFYDGIVFHRVEKSGQFQIIQTGDPLGKNPAKAGTGGPGYKFNDEPVKGDYTAGTLAMANSGANTNGSQFFINLTDNKQLPKSYNLFGKVVQGLNVAQKIQGPAGQSDANYQQTKNIKPDVMNHVVVVAAP
ncbi:MAG TPA: peptidylprolyl isomerase [Ktedonobacteraceae bacterium]|nr:peptidylprolyl isomerase [Ktedonobacteraceae bacterium]